MSIEKANKLNQLAEEAHALHREIQNAWTGALNKARLAGKKLIEAKKFLDGRSVSAWLASRFPEWSRETAYAYMRIAREWDGSKLTTARNNGIQYKSMRSVLKAIRTTKQKKRTEDEIKFKVVGEVINSISHYLWSLEIRELKVLLQIDNIWSKTVDSEVKEWDRFENGHIYELDQEIERMSKQVEEGAASERDLLRLERERKRQLELANRVNENLYT